MADREDRAAVLLERTLAAHAGEAPSVPGMAERVRGRARRRRATGVVRACAVAAILAAGVSIGVQWMVGDAPVHDGLANDPTSQRSDAVREIQIATSEWESGGGAMTAQAEGELTLTPAKCPVLRVPGGDTLSLVWPAGYGAYINGEGILQVYASDGQIVAEQGDHLSMGGGYLKAEADQACVDPGADEVFYIQDDLRPGH